MQSSLPILGIVEDFIRRFVWLADESLYLLISAWIVGTYLIPDYAYFGYLFICSVQKGAGKSVLLEVLDLLVYNSSGVQVSITEAVLFRTAFDATQLFDEIDTLLNHEYLRGVLNAGFKKGAVVPRMAQNAEGAWVTVKMPVYAARAMAGINEKTLDDTTRDRSFTIMMKPRSKEEPRERLRLSRVGYQADALRRVIAEWANENRDSVKAVYDHPERLAWLAGFRDRTIDIGEPLVAIVETANLRARDHDRLNDRARLLDAIAASRKEPNSYYEDAGFFQRLHEISESCDEDGVVGTATEIASLLGLPATSDSTDRVWRLLRTYGFENKSIRKDGIAKYRYALSWAALADVRRRYFAFDRAQRPTALVGVEDVGHPAASLFP